MFYSLLSTTHFVSAAEGTKPRQYKVIRRSMRGAWKHLLSDALLQPWYCSGESLLTLHILYLIRISADRPTLARSKLKIKEWIRTFLELKLYTLYKYGSLARKVVSKSTFEVPEMILKSFLKAKRNQYDTSSNARCIIFFTGPENCGLN